MIVIVLLLQIEIVFNIIVLASGECGMYLAPSKIPNAGRGIIAGSNFLDMQVIEEGPTLPIKSHIVHASQLYHYVYDTGNDGYDMVIFGPSSLYNHHSNRTVHYYWSDEPVSDPTINILPYANLTGSTFSTLTNITVGEEMLNYYGDDWFNRFQSSPSDDNNTLLKNQHPDKINITDLNTYGHCLTDVKIKESSLKGAGKGLFSERNFTIGEIVTISPVLSIPRHVAELSTNDSIFMNYLIESTTSDMLLFPINYGALINHNSVPNVRISWYDWGPAEAAFTYTNSTTNATNNNTNNNTLTDTTNTIKTFALKDKLSMTITELSEAHFAQLDIAYIATTTITQGEEIFLDYGVLWEYAWEIYTEKMKLWVETETNEQNDWSNIPIFRSTIQAPEGLYQEHWRRDSAIMQEKCPFH